MTAIPAPERVAMRLLKAMDAAVGLSLDDIGNIESLIDAGEWLVAFETLCTQIYEWEIPLEPEVIRDLEELGTVLGARTELTDHLWEDVGGQLRSGRKGVVTAGELMAELEADPAYQARMAEKRAVLDEQVRVWRAAEQPLVEELRQAGFEIKSVWDLVNTSVPYPTALPILVEHLDREYPARVIEGIARALAIPDANPYWGILRDAYRQAVESDVLRGLAVALAASATEENLPGLLELIADETQGSSRVLLLYRVLHLGGDEGYAAIENLKGHEVLGKEATALLKEREQRAARRKRDS